MTDQTDFVTEPSVQLISIKIPAANEAPIMQNTQTSSRLTVHLPNPVPSVELPPTLADILTLLIAAGEQGINSLDLQAKPFCDPANKIAQLRKAGAIIETVREPAWDSYGVRHNSVARYIYRGWSLA